MKLNLLWPYYTINAPHNTDITAEITGLYCRVVNSLSAIIWRWKVTVAFLSTLARFYNDFTRWIKIINRSETWTVWCYDRGNCKPCVRGTGGIGPAFGAPSPGRNRPGNKWLPSHRDDLISDLNNQCQMVRVCWFWVNLDQKEHLWGVGQLIYATSTPQHFFI